jgi:hypothetical protein
MLLGVIQITEDDGHAMPFSPGEKILARRSGLSMKTAAYCIGLEVKIQQLPNSLATQLRALPKPSAILFHKLLI